MQARRFFVLFILSACPHSVIAQSPTVLSAVGGRAAIPLGVTIVPAGNNVRVQWIIPRYANGKTPPAGALVGWGPMSVVRGNADTEKLPADRRSVVMTQDYDQPIRQFHSQLPTDTVLPPVLQPVIRDLTITGPDLGGDDWHSAGGIFDTGVSPPDVTLPDGIHWKASGGLVENVTIFGCGTAAYFTRGCCPKDKLGGTRPFDNEKLKLWNVSVQRCNRGIEVAVVDAIVGNVSGSNCAEYTLKLSGGATQIAGAIHSWGGRKGTWLIGDGNWGGPLYCEQDEVPLCIDSNLNDLGPIYSWGGTKACVAVNGSHNTLSQLRIRYQSGTQPVGLAVSGQYNTVSVGSVDVAPDGRGIVIEKIGGWGLRLRDVRVTGGGPKAKCIDLTGGEPVYYASIDVHLDGSGVGLDLTRDNGSSVLAARNEINVTTSVNTGLTKIVDLPAGWQSTTPRKTTNVITINGVRWYPPKDE